MIHKVIKMKVIEIIIVQVYVANFGLQLFFKLFSCVYFIIVVQHQYNNTNQKNI